MLGFDRKTLTQELEQAQNTLAALMESIPEGITVAEAPDVTIRMVSAYGASLAGRPREELEQIPADERAIVWDLLRPCDLKRPHADELPLTRAVKLGEQVFDEEWILRKPDGQLVNIICNAAPIRNKRGKITGGVIAWRDLRVPSTENENLEARYRHERSLSQVLQTALISTTPERVDGITIESAYLPAARGERVGGDFFDIFHPADERIAVVIGDVTGNGIGAALRTSIAKNMLRAYAYEDPEPAAVVSRVNRALARELPPEVFITLFYGLIDVANREMAFTCAGHEPPIWVLPDQLRAVELYRPQPPLTVVSETSYTQHRIELPSDCRLLLYTDGITEARDPVTRAFYGRERLVEIMLRLAQATAVECIDAVVKDVFSFSARPADDIAALLVCVD